MELVLTLNVTSNSGYRRGTQGSAIFVSDVDAALNPAGEKLKKLWHLYKALEATKEFIKEANNPDTKDGLACKALQIAALAAEATEPLIELFK